MGKLIPLLFAGAGTATASVGGFYLVKGSGLAGIGEENSASETVGGSTTISQTNFEFEDVDAFRKGMKNSSCINGYFANISDANGATDMGSGSPADNLFFKAAESSTEKDPYKSCLTIERKVMNYEGEKWSGKFTWLWTFIREDEGFITFNIMETSDQENEKFKFTGVFYLVGKNGDSWEIKHKKESRNNLLVTADDLETHFPKAGDDLKNSVGGDYWGFVDSKEKLKKSCQTSACGSASASGSTFIGRKFV